MNQEWPVTRFYWSVLDAPAGRPGPLPPGLLAVFEDDAPLPIQDLWAIGARDPDGRLIICAARRSELASLDSGVLRLCPDHVPEFVNAEPVAFNLLVGDYEPRTIRRARLRRHALAAAAVLLGATLVGVGLSRRAAAWSAEAASVRVESRAVVSSVAPSAFWTAEDLAMEVMQKRQATPEELKLPGDAALTLSSLIAHWPTEVPAKAQSVAAFADSASLAVTVPGDPAAFLAALKAPEGWQFEEPRLAAIDKGTRLTLELKRSPP